MAFDLSKARRPLKRRSSLLKRIYEYEDDEDESIVVPTEVGQRRRSGLPA